jgi:hypothetical protein
MTLTIPAADLQARDIIHTPNWDEHVVRAWADTRGVAVVVAEFPDLILHYALAEPLSVERAA